MKILLLAVTMLLGPAMMAQADDEISCASGDQDCISGKVELGEAQMRKNNREEARRNKKAKFKSHAPEYVPCGGDTTAEGCQRGVMDKIDRANGENVED